MWKFMASFRVQSQNVPEETKENGEKRKEIKLMTS
jgi:hypothetical protein